MLRTVRSRIAASWALWTTTALLSLSAWPALGAQDAPPPDLQAERKAASEAAAKALIRGPTELPFADQASMQLPANYHFIPLAEAGRLMKSMGNSVDTGFQGLVVPDAPNNHSFFVVSYHSTGYIKDDDAKDWNADKLLDQMREGTAEGNKRRVEMGIPEMEVTGWIQPPKYEPASHQVVWSVAARDKGAQASDDDSINYKTLVLGREGYMAMTLVTSPPHIEAMRPSVATLLDGLKFNNGKSYADFNSSTDHVAEFGLAALVAGVAAKKLGLIALIAAFVVKFAKVIVLAAAGVLVALRKWLGLKKDAPPAPSAATASSPTATASAPTASSPTDSA